MEIPEPKNNQFTIYSKSGCPNCIKVKKLLQEKQIIFTVIDCDEFILENKETFLQFIHNLAKKEYKFFPMVFDNGHFIGGFTDTVEYVENILNFNESF
jgi:glutaredoxin